MKMMVMVMVMMVMFDVDLGGDICSLDLVLS